VNALLMQDLLVFPSLAHLVALPGAPKDVDLHFRTF